MTGKLTVQMDSPLFPQRLYLQSAEWTAIVDPFAGANVALNLAQRHTQRPGDQPGIGSQVAELVRRDADMEIFLGHRQLDPVPIEDPAPAGFQNPLLLPGPLGLGSPLAALDQLQLPRTNEHRE